MFISFKPLWMKAVNEIFVTRLSGICETWSNLMPLRLTLGAWNKHCFYLLGSSTSLKFDNFLLCVPIYLYTFSP